jgi:hypothetical protein
MIDTDDSEIMQTASLDRSLNSLDDLARASNDIAAQLLGLAPPAAAATPAPASQAPAPAANKECAEKYNINEVVSKIQSGFPKQLKDCSVTLAKNMALAMSPFGKKTPMKDPATFMKECTIDGIKQKLPAGAGEYVKPIESFIQNLLGAAMAGSSLDVKKLSGAIGGMNVNSLISELKAKAANDPCIVNEPYEPSDDDGGDSSEDEPYGGKRKVVSFGLRLGMNFSHLNAEYHDSRIGSRDGDGSYDPILGFQAGFVLDIAPSSWFHIQPGLMYVRKGAEDKDGTTMILHYIEVPLLLSLKFSALRINAGPYVGICSDVGGSRDGTYIVGVSGNNYGYSDEVSLLDFGLSVGLGFDIGMFYIGVFYDYGLVDSYSYYANNYGSYKELMASSRTFGFNLGINL